MVAREMASARVDRVKGGMGRMKSERGMMDVGEGGSHTMAFSRPGSQRVGGFHMCK